MNKPEGLKVSYVRKTFLFGRMAHERGDIIFAFCKECFHLHSACKDGCSNRLDSPTHTEERLELSPNIQAESKTQLATISLL